MIDAALFCLLLFEPEPSEYRKYKKMCFESFANNPCHEELIYTLGQKKIVPQNEFTVIFGVLKK